MELADIRVTYENIKENIKKVLVIKEDVMDNIMICLMCRGHVLLEDVPGVGKTVMAKSIAASVKGTYKRIQFTPDLLPSYLTGINYYNQKEEKFIYREGPLFANIIIADEINRATPRTQSSLLECMEEGQVTVDGDTKILPKPFFVIATQNPVETQGTFPLPEAQLDRFFMRLKMGYPDKGMGLKILDRFIKDNEDLNLKGVVNVLDILETQSFYNNVSINDTVREYLMDIVEETRRDSRIILGASPRGSLMLMKASQAKAVLSGRDFVTADDVKSMAIPVLSHRILLKTSYTLNQSSAQEECISDVLSRVKAPLEEI